MNNDLISRSDLKKAIETYDKFACLPDCKLEPFRNLEHPEMFEPYVHLRDILNAIDKAPTVEPKLSNEQIEKITDLLETEWGYEGIREDVSRILREADNDNA